MQAKRDQNHIPTMLGTLNTDGDTPTNIQADPSLHALLAVNGTSGTDQSSNNDADRDENSVPVLLAVSEVDGVTPVQLYVNSSGELLIDSN